MNVRFVLCCTCSYSEVEIAFSTSKESVLISLFIAFFCLIITIWQMVLLPKEQSEREVNLQAFPRPDFNEYFERKMSTRNHIGIPDKFTDP